MDAQLAVAAPSAPAAAPTLSANAPVTATPDVAPAPPPKKSLTFTPVAAPAAGPLGSLISAPLSAPATAPAPGPLANAKNAGMKMAVTSGWTTLLISSSALVVSAMI
ncbi:hypothetical protein MPTK1_8g02340 [Marchantia polymorpha subsp. ruderalis]|nr:hypothetical protein MARPO_0012s0031 [Marchantia polymorpha]BBN18421.1 hypothetical protein Mp_8g02340 [Marchantia polymorpha subsp. ruderalis]|eukprot:PTQ46068.1 hypothetical protein MARPO_0012s0031 [Marchantia polymorpha]